MPRRAKGPDVASNFNPILRISCQEEPSQFYCLYGASAWRPDAAMDALSRPVPVPAEALAAVAREVSMTMMPAIARPNLLGSLEPDSAAARSLALCLLLLRWLWYGF